MSEEVRGGQRRYGEVREKWKRSEVVIDGHREYQMSTNRVRGSQMRS